LKARDLINSIGSYTSSSPFEDFPVRGVSCNSGEVQDGFIFVAIRGTHEDGHKFIDEAIRKGAKAVVVQGSGFPSTSLGTGRVQGSGKISFIIVEDTRQALAKLAAEFSGRPSRKIKVIGVTGTNGKTTVTYLIEAILQEAGFSPGVIGTVNYRFKDKIIPSKNTTPGPVEIQSLLADMARDGLEYALMEVSSHALDQERIGEIAFHSAIFTNLTQDHLDYHHNLENYFQAKTKLFKNLLPESFAIVNNDDAYADRLKGLTRAKVITYGIERNCDISAENIRSDIAHSEFSVLGRKDLAMTSHLIGRHNIYNMLASIAWALSEGIKPEIIKSAIQKFSLVPGRMEQITCPGFYIFVDYAHTEDALNNALRTLRPFSQGRLIVVFGCGGERDKTKRPKMGYTVTELADYAVITNDNPRSEDPQEIINDIKKGIQKENFCVIPERLQAIKESLAMAHSGDIVLIAGKGHEDYQILNNRREHFDDREAVRECLKSMKF